MGQLDDNSVHPDYYTLKSAAKKAELPMHIMKINLDSLEKHEDVEELNALLLK